MKIFKTICKVSLLMALLIILMGSSSCETKWVGANNIDDHYLGNYVVSEDCSIKDRSGSWIPAHCHTSGTETITVSNKYLFKKTGLNIKNLEVLVYNIDKKDKKVTPQDIIARMSFNHDERFDDLLVGPSGYRNEGDYSAEGEYGSPGVHYDVDYYFYNCIDRNHAEDYKHKLTITYQWSDEEIFYTKDIYLILNSK